MKKTSSKIVTIYQKEDGRMVFVFNNASLAKDKKSVFVGRRKK